MTSNRLLTLEQPIKHNTLRRRVRTPKARDLPLINFAKDLYKGTPLNGVYLIGLQHIVSSTYVMLQALFEKGLSKHNVSLIGKCYSTDPDVYQDMLQAGIDACPSSLVFDSQKSFDDQFKKNVKAFLTSRYEIISKFKKIIILDDGGELLSLASEVFSDTTCELIGVEQTTAGFEKVKSINPGFPIINVARSWAKLTYESPFIVRGAIESFFRRFSNLPIHKKLKNILIIGNGAIGSSIYTMLKDDYAVTIFDREQSKSNIQLDNFEASLKEFDLIIGCTGKKALRSDQYHLLKKGAILMSVSSSDREFDAEKLRQKTGVPLHCHQDICVDNIYLMNCGFPINFDSNYKEIDIDEFQLTRSLLLCAVLQGATNRVDCAGFINLNEKHQKVIVNQYLSIYPSITENIAKPLKKRSILQR
ncbi:MAG: hypothetical protein HKM07_04230 [Chlamydiae bacterium]|nr:hypothetical protein [Chlamydiota bacterium]